MSDATSSHTPPRRFFLTILALALAARAIAVLETAGTPLARILVGDGAHFDRWARELAGAPLGTSWIGSEVFYQAPLYPYFLGTVYSWFGPDPFIARLLQAMLGALACALVALATRRTFGVRSGWIAGIFCAFYGPWIWFDGLIQKTSLALFLTAALLERLTAPDGRKGKPLACGALLGLLALTRENALILAPLVFIAVARKPATSESSALPRIGLFVLGLVLTLGPVAWRNAHLGGGFVPTAFNAGVNFYLGNRAEADGRYTALVHGNEDPLRERADAIRLAEAAVGHELAPAEVSSYWFGRGIDDVRESPARWFGLLVQKSLLVVNDHELMDSDALPLWRAQSKLLDLATDVFRFGTLFALAILGIGLARGRFGTTWLFSVSAATLALSLVLFFVTARFRIGLVPFLVPFAALACVRLLEKPNGRDFLRTARWLLAPTLIAFWPVSAPPLSLDGNELALAWSNLASGALSQDDSETAQSAAEQALLIDPDLATAHYNLGVASRLNERAIQAREALNRSFLIEPTFEADARFQLGLLEATLGDERAALPHFRRAAKLAPNDADSRFNHGLVLERLGYGDQARAEYEACLRLDPQHERARAKTGP